MFAKDCQTSILETYTINLGKFSKNGVKIIIQMRAFQRDTVQNKLTPSPKTFVIVALYEILKLVEMSFLIHLYPKK